MSIQPMWPDHLLDLDEWSALPEDTSRRFELAEGVLVVSPRAVVRHQKLVRLLLGRLHAQSRGRWQALPDVEVVIEGGAAATVRVPDLVLARPDVGDDAPRLGAADLIAVVEVTSPGSRRLDRVLKLHEYATAGVPTYLLVEPGPPATATELRLDGATYTATAAPAATVELGFGATVDLYA